MTDAARPVKAPGLFRPQCPQSPEHDHATAYARFSKASGDEQREYARCVCHDCGEQWTQETDGRPDRLSRYITGLSQAIEDATPFDVDDGDDSIAVLYLPLDDARQIVDDLKELTGLR